MMPTNDELIAAVLSGEHVAFAKLLRRYERASWTTAWRILRDYHSAQDATQNAFLLPIFPDQITDSNFAKQAIRHVERFRSFDKVTVPDQGKELPAGTPDAPPNL